MAIEAVPLAASEKASSMGGRVSAVTEPGAIDADHGGVRSIQTVNGMPAATSPLTSAPPTAPWWIPSPSAAADRQSRA